MVFGLYRKSHLFNYFMILPTCVYFLKNIYHMGRLSIESLEHKLKEAILPNVSLSWLQLKKLQKWHILLIQGTGIPQLS